MSFGGAHLFEEKWGLNLQTGQKVASIIAFSGAIEYYLERAIWKLQGLDPKGRRPFTDAEPITKMIDILFETISLLPSKDLKIMLETWCSACKSGFIIRNNIAHGVPMKIGNTLIFCRNPRWHGEQRKREFGDFWADEHTLSMVCEAFAVLLRVIAEVEKNGQSEKITEQPIVMMALKEANSMLGEFASQSYNPGFEKY